jgi:glycosyltransferase involved in cell wall biosynthesis
MGVAIKKLVERTGLPVVTHDHDFHWERGDRYISEHKEVNDYVNNHFPLLLPDVSHAVINTFGLETFHNRFGIKATLVPNVMDFDRPYGLPTEGNRSFLSNIGVKENEIALLQVTRIVRRKGIETAIDLVEQLNDHKIKLVITGNYNDDEKNEYYNELVNQIHDLNLSNQVIFGAHMVKDHKDLSDVYAHGRACTYFSTYEGFGNAFVEAVLAKKPIFVNNYQPVYMQDIGCKGFETVMLEDSELTHEKVNQISDIIYNPDRCMEIGESNYKLGKKHFSFQILQEKLEGLFKF